MTIEFILFVGLFVVTIGIVAIGVLLAFNLLKKYNQPFVQTLLYQQIFSFSFLVYGIWGKIAIQQLTTNIAIEKELLDKVLFYIPLLGLPFLFISWYMLIKLVMLLKNKTTNLWVVSGFFVVYPVLFTVGLIVCQNNFLGLEVPQTAILPRIFLLLNITIQLTGMAIYLLIRHPLKNKNLPRINPGYMAVYLIVLVFYSVGLWLVHIHFSIAAAAILLLFLANGSISVMIHHSLLKIPTEESLQELDFIEFCNQYEISKREAEIIQEICSGKSNKEIAEALFITLQTVKDHTHRIYTKTGIKNRTQLANQVREKLNA